MPRTCSTAILYSSKKSKKLHEPFSYRIVLNGYLYNLGAETNWHESWSLNEWEQLKLSMADPDTCTKFFGSQIHLLPWSHDWWEQVQSSTDYEVFVVYRDIRKILHSYILAPHFGHFVEENREPADKVFISEGTFSSFIRDVKTFLHYLPRNGRLISWEHLPDQYFDRTKNHIIEQHSETKLNRIENYDYCMRRVDNLVQELQKPYQERLFALPWA